LANGGVAQRPIARSYRLYHLLWSGIDLLFPPSCGGCGAPGSRWCMRCQQQAPSIPEPVCMVCGTTLGELSPELCPECRRLRPQFHFLRSWSAFGGPVRKALHRLKYRRDMGLGEALTPQLTCFAAGLAWPIDLVIPVPLGRKRLRERGYNQVALIARPLAMALGVVYDQHAVARVWDTRSQVGLARRERRDNVVTLSWPHQPESAGAPSCSSTTSQRPALRFRPAQVHFVRPERGTFLL
jgi:predicted amidophosphoribosyltransferase